MPPYVISSCFFFIVLAPGDNTTWQKSATVYFRAAAVPIDVQVNTIKYVKVYTIKNVLLQQALPALLLIFFSGMQIDFTDFEKGTLLVKIEALDEIMCLCS